MTEAPSRYEDGVLRDLASIYRNATRAVDFSGRATRTEMVVYYIGANVLVGLAFVVVQLAFALSPTGFLRLIQLLPMLAMPALMARRFHDAGHQGILAAAVSALLVALGAWDGWIKFRAGPYALDASAFEAFPAARWAVAAIAIILVGLAFRPGTLGANRFGPDPRGRLSDGEIAQGG